MHKQKRNQLSFTLVQYEITAKSTWISYIDQLNHILIHCPN
jgi:hypothetical protein